MRSRRANGSSQPYVRVRSWATGETLPPDGVALHASGLAPALRRPSGSRATAVTRPADHGGHTDTSCPRRWRSATTRAPNRDSRTSDFGSNPRGKNDEMRWSVWNSGASIASCRFMPRSTWRRRTWSAHCSCWSPPGVPHTRYGSPSRSTRPGQSVVRGACRDEATTAGPPRARTSAHGCRAASRARVSPASSAASHRWASRRSCSRSDRRYPGARSRGPARPSRPWRRGRGSAGVVRGPGCSPRTRIPRRVLGAPSLYSAERRTSSGTSARSP